MPGRLNEQPMPQSADRQRREQAPLRPSGDDRRDRSGLLQLQRSVGNRTVQRAVQRGLTVAPADSAAERQAEQQAAALPSAGQHRPQLEAQPTLRTGVTVPTLQRAAEAAPEAQALDVPDAAQLAAAGSGSALPQDARGSLEAHLGADFSGVRVHTGPTAAQLAEGLEARAFTTGHDIYFGAGEYRPQQHSGQQLIAHELTHVVQQQAAPAAGSPQLQLARKKGKNARRRKKERQQQAAAQAQPQQQAQPDEEQGWLGWGMSKLAGLAGMIAYEGEHENESEAEYELGSAEHGEPEAEEEESGSVADDFITIKTIKLKLVDKEDAQFERGPLKGSAEAAVSSEGLTGKAELSVELWNSENKNKVFQWDVAGGKLKGDDTMEGFAGVKAELEAGASVQREEGNTLPSSVSARAKAKAFAGFSAERTVAVSIVGADDKQLVTASGKLGFSVGVGGEYSGTLTWQGGRLQIGGKAKAALGVGGSFGFSLEIDPMNVGRSFFSYLGSWASWAYNQL